MGENSNTNVTTQGSKERVANTVREIYRPILRGYFTVFALYYLIMTPLNYWSLTGGDLIALVLASSIAAVVGVFGAWYMRKAALPIRVEALLLSMNCLVIVNVTVALTVEFAAMKMTYFIIMVMLFALASVSFRQASASIAMALLAMFLFMPNLDSPTFAAFSFLSFAAAMASLAIAYFLRRAVMNIADAKVEAERELAKARDVSEEMRARSLSDSLTSLPNRRAFFDELRRSLSALRRKESTNPVWLLLLDLDGFKSVNDVHGHLTGDLLLKQVAGRLEMFAGDTLHVSRMGGDEFNVIMATSDSEDQVLERCQKLLDLLCEIYIIDGRHVRISCSIGCKLLDPGEASRTQINQADFALMAAKKKGKNCVMLFDEAQADSANARFKIESALRNADLSKEITLLYQPQYDLASGSFVSAEVLARWSSPTLGQVGPDSFIKIAEESGLITDITMLVVAKAFCEMRDWPNPIPLSINLSSLDLISDPIIEQIIDAAKTYGIDPRLVEFEVTETAMLADFEKASANLVRMSDVGFSIALDDFGTGYSNFNYLRALPIDKLKVDRSFMENPGDPMTEKILQSLAGMARALGVHCLLEGVESELDLVTAKRVGAESVQGFLFGKPMDGASLVDAMASQDGEPAVKQSA